MSHRCGSQYNIFQRPPKLMLAFSAERSLIVNEEWRNRITLEPGKRSGRPCIRGMRITVYDVLSYLAAGMTVAELLNDFPYLTQEDVQACLAFAAERERRILVAVA
jgi:uncharacterized protein (DUF433 family)